MANTEDGSELVVEIQELAVVEERYEPNEVIPSFSHAEVQRLVRSTLTESSRALGRAAFANWIILVFGATLVMAAFVAAIVTGDWKALAFGGIGLGIILTTLITNPLRAIGVEARRLVHLQVAYLGFLTHLSLMKSSREDTIDSAIEKSKQLQEVMNSIQEALHTHYE